LESSADKSSEHILPPIEGRFEVMLGLALEQHPPEETHPSLEEIAGWYDQTLPQARSPQVKTHVARCRECYAVWFSLVECGRGGEVVPAPGAFARAVAACASWLNQPRAWGVVATGLAAVGVAATYLIAPGDPAWLQTIDHGYRSLSGAVAQSAPSAARWPWGRGLGARAMDNPWERLAEIRISHAHEAARAAFGVGVRVGLSESLHDTSEWTSVLAALPAEPPACTRAELPPWAACEDINTIFEGVGRWAVLLHFACLLDRQPGGQQPDAAFWRDQIGVLEKVGGAIDEHLPSDAFGRFFSDWSAESLASNDPRAVLCAREASLLSLGLD
jgi:hypothetical protein